MNTMRLILNCLAAGGLALAVAQVSAAPMTYLGYDQNDQNANGAIPVGSAFSTVRANFETTLNSAGILRETFGTGNSAAGASLSVFGGTSTITQTNLLVANPNPPFTPLNFGLRGSVKNSPAGGRYNTTGHGAGNPSPPGAWWESDGVFSLNLGGKFQALGFDATDFSDFDGVLTMTLFDGTQQGEVLTLTRPAGVTSPLSGSVLFYGLSSSVEFDRVVFSIAQASPRDITSYDSIGFDQFTVGRLKDGATGNVPEPGTLALVALALAGVGFSRSRKTA